MDDRAPEMLKPTLIAGLAFGVLGALPGFNLINCCTCCGLIVACGVTASYLYSAECRRKGVEFRAGQGALVGLVAGGFYAMANTIVSAIVRLLIGDRMTRWFLDQVETMPNIPPEYQEMFDNFRERAGSFTVFDLVINLIATVFLAVIFSTLGGLLGGALFKVPAPPPPPAPPMGGDLGPPLPPQML